MKQKIVNWLKDLLTKDFRNFNNNYKRQNTNYSFQIKPIKN